ncbi:phage protein NinX family protein [Pseudomonas sp. 1176_21]|uniref:phage protein NinX family protein n=1 Tax=Pseudomonas sp. 1176_21 TaxID=2604453 RepID=UPI0005C1EF25|nr:hypothetical protein QV12_07040 [Pseudomonas putida]
MTDLIEVNTAELLGEQLAWAVAEAEGLDVHVAKPHYGAPARVFVRYRGEATERCERYSPQENWMLGGQLIEKYRIVFGLYSDSFFAVTGRDDVSGDADGSTHLLAAYRAITAAKLGGTVEVPKELMPQTE